MNLCISHSALLMFADDIATCKEIESQSDQDMLQADLKRVFESGFPFFINSPFLWSKVPPNILQIKDPKQFCVALRQFLFQLSVALYLSVFVLATLFAFVCCPCVLYLSFWGARLQAQPFV